MSTKRVWWISTSIVLAAAVGAVAVTGIAVQRNYDDLDHGTPFAVQSQPEVLRPVTADSAAASPVDSAAIAGKLNSIKERYPDLNNIGAQVIDTASGQAVWDNRGSTPLLPASTTKVLTAAAATLVLDQDKTIETHIVRGDNPRELYVKSAGDVWMTLAQLDKVAEDIKAVAPEVDSLIVDNSVWTGPEQAPAWDPQNVDGGFIAPMQPTMVFGARMGADHGTVPRSHNPSYDMAKWLGRRIGAKTVGIGPAPKNTEDVAKIVSPPLATRLETTLKTSDNVMAEGIGREVALATGAEPSFAGTAAAVVNVLREHGVDVTGVNIKDSSGLSTDNRIPAKVLAGIMDQAVTGDKLRPLLGYLPVAGGDGTLYTRYAQMPGRGFVRAKTGTLTGTSALAGIAQGASDHIYAFAFLVNDGDVMNARRLQDELASALREF